MGSSMEANSYVTLVKVTELASEASEAIVKLRPE
jgi:hypothetical protein